MEVFFEISSVIAIAAGFSLLMYLLKQPLIVGYILTGLLAGPYGLDVIKDTHTLELFSKFGIAMLLFIVGLHLSPKVIREVGKVSLLAGLGQIIITSTIGFFIATLLGIDRIGALYIGIAITFSSTIIILKLLSDKGDLNKLYGKIAIGLLLMQDIIATVILILSSTVSNSGGNSLSVIIVFTLVKGMLLFNILLAVSAFLLPRVIHFIARSQELLFIFSLAWGMGLATVFSWMGFSVEIGALVAGVTLASTPYAHEMSSRLKPLRDFFVILFFILLGAQMSFGNIQTTLPAAIILSLFVLFGNPIIVIALTSLLGYKKRISFLTGMTITQVSEFSLIIATLGFEVGHLTKDVLSLITLTGLITITFSTYLIMHAKSIYPKVSHLLEYLSLKKSSKSAIVEEKPHEAVLFGYHTVGHDYVELLKKLELDFIVVDINPERIRLLKSRDIAHTYGDAEDPEFLEELYLGTVKFVITTIPNFKTNVYITKKIRAVNKKAIIICLAHNAAEAQGLYSHGATYVVIPHYLGVQYALRTLSSNGLDHKAYEDLREKHVEFLGKRK